MEEKIEKIRIEIDNLDKKIVELISDRARVAQKIADLKSRENIPVFRPDRETAVYDKIQKLNRGPLSSKHLRAIYREIMSSIIELEGAFEFCYLGPNASFTHQAAINKFGSSLRSTHLDTIPNIFRAVESGEFRYGVVPIENTIEGVVTNTLDQFVHSNLKIYSEAYLRINLCLLTNCTKPEKIKNIYSHRHALAQCRDWLGRTFPGVEYIETSSTSKAASIVWKKKHSAAIASELAAKVYNLQVVNRWIQDFPSNVTRFFVIGKDFASPTGNDKTSLVCSLPDKPGALYKIIEPFANDDINLTKIESRPNRRENWEYNFFIDLDGHVNDKPVKGVLEELAKRTTFLKVLGSFPKENFQ
jgi:chorismate mutase/prephenate dehydratase